MARKLLIMAAFISLVLLAYVPPGFADTYTLSGGDFVDVTWAEMHGVNLAGNPVPGLADGRFHGGYPAADGTFTDWKIAMLTNPDPGEVIASDDITVTYKITYDSLLSDGIEGPGDTTRFVVNIPGLSLSSSDFVLIATANYNKLPSAQHWINHWETVYGYGHNDSDNDTYFTLTGTLMETTGDSNHYGYIVDFKLDYNPSSDPITSQTPIPGAVWLLGSGLLGLACLRPRRRQ
jgi:hypothetical protein